MNKVSIFGIFKDEELIYISYTKDFTGRTRNIKKLGLKEYPGVDFSNKDYIFTVLEIVEITLVENKIQEYKDSYGIETDKEIIVIEKDTMKELGIYNINEIVETFGLSKKMIMNVLDGKTKSQKGLILKYK